jgi:hypothetical protein
VDVDAAIEDAWARVAREWDDARAHEAFVVLCASTERLGEAGRRYREVRERDPERAPTASAQIDRVLGLAMQSLSALKTDPSPRSAKTKMLLVAVGVSGAMIASAVLALLRLL